MNARRRSSPRPRKALGQHFLRDADVLGRIAASVPRDGRLVVEIGPGTGELTAALLDVGHEVIAVEIDSRMLRHLRARFAANPRLQLVQGDARELHISEIAPGREYNVAGNLPYFAANPIIRAFLEAPEQPHVAVVMVQKEVAQEIAAPPGKFSLLSISILVYAEPEYLFDVPPEAFDPPPNVVSAVVRLVIRDQPLVPRPEIDRFFEVVAKTFRNPRKQIHNALSRGLWRAPEVASAVLDAAGIETTRRPETLSVEEWKRVVAEVERLAP